MLKKIILACALTGTAASAASAVNLDLFEPDFNVLMTSIVRDVAPTLRLGALAGDLQADATIDHFDGAFGLGLNTADGVAKVLRHGSTEWAFAAHLDDIIPSNFSQKLMLYPSFKFAFGFALIDGWDAILSGNYLPSSLFSAVAKPFTPGGKSVPDMGYSNIGVVVRKTLLRDTGAINSSPALSLGVGYHFTSFSLDVDAAGWIPDFELSGSNVSTTGSLAFDSVAHIVTMDVHVSKHLGFFTPYAKLVGAYQNTTVNGNAALTATADDATNTTKDLVAKPSVTLSDFAFLTTLGIDLDLFIFHYNLNVMTDLSRALLKVRNFSLDGIDANAFSINTGLHWSF